MNGFPSDCFQFLKMWTRRLSCWHLCLALLAGCNSATAPVDVNVARKTLESTMQSWKAGKSPDDLRAESPSIVIQEMEWTNGAALLEYEIIDDDKPVDQNLIAKVKLKLKQSDGRVVDKTATYVVGTRPVLTVFRDIMK